jgi:Rieske Fe-S protein
LSSIHDEKPHVPPPSLWPIGFAIGIACILVGVVINLWVLLAGAVLAVVFGYLWVADLFREHGPARATARVEEIETEEIQEVHAPTYDRSVFLSAATLGIGGVIGGLVTLPVLGFAVIPSFEGSNREEIDLGPITRFPEGKYVVASFIEDPDEGEVSRRTAFVRNNGVTTAGVPSFTVIYSRCVHLGCPTQANGPTDGRASEYTKDGKPPVRLQPVLAASFGCPCHGGLYDAEGNRRSGPPVRSLDRYEFSIRNGNLYLGKLFSVGKVQGAGASAVITRYEHTSPGVHIDGAERILYPFPVPGND